MTPASNKIIQFYLNRNSTLHADFVTVSLRSNILASDGFRKDIPNLCNWSVLFCKKLFCNGLAWVCSVALKHSMDQSVIEQIHFPPYSKNITTPLQGIPFNPRNNHCVFWESYDKHKDYVYCVFFNVKEVSTYYFCFFFQTQQFLRLCSFGDRQTDRHRALVERHEPVKTEVL